MNLRTRTTPPEPSGSLLAGLPSDLSAVLRDQGIVIEKDADVWALVGKWAAAPSNTASASLNPHGPYTIELDYDGTKVTWSSMYAGDDRTFRLRFGAESLERLRRRDDEEVAP